MKHIKAGGSSKSPRRDTKLNRAGERDTEAQSRKPLSHTQSQRLSQSQRISRTQSQPAAAQSLEEKTEEQAKLAMKRRIIHIAIAAFAAIFIISIAVVLKMAGEERSYNAYFAQAQQCYSESNYEAALVYLRKAASLSETDESLLLMADCYIACGNMEKALEILRTMDVSDQQGLPLPGGRQKPCA